MAPERIGSIEVCLRAQYIRVIMAELERLHSHLLWAGIAAELIGFGTLFMHAFRMREQVMDLLETISGNRVNYSMNRIGGVNRDIGDPGAVLEGVRAIRDEVSQTLIPVFTADRTAAARCRRIGILSRPDAIAHRESTAIYAALDFSVPVQTDGDVQARIVVRALEILESCRMIEQALQKIRSGPLHAKDIGAAGGGWLRESKRRGERCSTTLHRMGATRRSA